MPTNYIKTLFGAASFFAVLSCSGQKPFTKVICLQYDNQQKGKVQPDTVSIQWCKNGEIVKSIFYNRSEWFSEKMTITMSDSGKEMENVTTLFKNEKLVVNEKRIIDLQSMAVVKSFDLVKNSESTPALEKDKDGRIVRVMNEKPYSYTTITYPHAGTVVHRLYNRTDDNRFFIYDSLTMIQKHRIVNVLAINLQQKKVTITESKYNDRLDAVGFRVMSAEMTPVDKSNNSDLPDDQLFDKLYQMIPLVKTENEWSVSAFNKDGHPATGIKKVYDANGQIKTYTLKFVYE